MLLLYRSVYNNNIAPVLMDLAHVQCHVMGECCTCCSLRGSGRKPAACAHGYNQVGGAKGKNFPFAPPTSLPHAEISQYRESLIGLGCKAKGI